MAVKIRLQRQGKKGKPFYHIVAADSKTKRDGKYIERLGTYNPNTNPATIDLKFENTLDWVKKGAQPTDTARAILSYKGVMLKNHLDRGVLKGAFTQAEADKKFEIWLNDKESRILAKKDKLNKDAQSDLSKRLAVEKEQAENKAKEIAAKNSPIAEEISTDQEPTSEAPAEEAKAEASAEEVKAEASAEEVKAEAPAEEVKTEAPAEEVKAEAPAEEVKAEAPAPAEETPNEETPSEEEKAE